MPTGIAGQGEDETFSETSQNSRKLATGGFTPDTQIITAAGPVQVSELASGDTVYALEPMTRSVKLKPITNVERVSYDGNLLALETNRCDLHVHPTHRMVCRTVGQSDLEIRPARTLEEYEHYKLVNGWQTHPGKRLDEADITDLVDDYEMCATTEIHGHTVRKKLPEGCEPVRRNSLGYFFDPKTFKQYQNEIESIAANVTIHAGPNAHRRPYRFDGDDFVEFLGWFVTEGSTYWSESSDTIQVKIAQEDPAHRRSIRNLLDRMELTGYTDSRSFNFASKVFGQLLESLCGAGSHTKVLPAFVWDLSYGQQELLFKILLAGDADDAGTYYTASDRLAGQMCRLHVELGLKPKWSLRRGTWSVCGRDVNDGFRTSENVRRMEFDGELSRLTIADYSTVMAGRNGKFQWIGVSNVS